MNAPTSERERGQDDLGRSYDRPGQYRDDEQGATYMRGRGEQQRGFNEQGRSSYSWGDQRYGSDPRNSERSYGYDQWERGTQGRGDMREEENGERRLSRGRYRDNDQGRQFQGGRDGQRGWGGERHGQEQERSNWGGDRHGQEQGRSNWGGDRHGQEQGRNSWGGERYGQEQGRNNWGGERYGREQGRNSWGNGHHDVRQGGHRHDPYDRPYYDERNDSQEGGRMSGRYADERQQYGGYNERNGRYGQGGFDASYNERGGRYQEERGFDRDSYPTDGYGGRRDRDQDRWS